MDNRRRQKKHPQKKKAQNDQQNENPQQRLYREEQRLLEYAMQLSLKETSMNPEEVADFATESLEAHNPLPLFEQTLQNAILQFDPNLASLINTDDDIATDDIKESYTSHFQNYQQSLLSSLGKTGDKNAEKALKEKLNLILLFASVLGYSRIVKYLLVRGANPLSKPYQGWTSMHWAAARGHVSVVHCFLKYLQSNQPNLSLLHDYKDKYEMTPLDILAQEYQQVPVKLSMAELSSFDRYKDDKARFSTFNLSFDPSSANDPSFIHQGRLFGSSTSKPSINQEEEEEDEEYEDEDEEFEEDEETNSSNIQSQENAENSTKRERRDDSNEPKSQLYAWGGSNLQGHGDFATRSNPKRVLSLEKETVKSISSSQFNSAVVTESGKVYIWGLSEGMRLGYNLDSKNAKQEVVPKLIPESLFGNRSIIQVSLSNYHGAFLTEDGNLYMFGRNREGQLGIGISNCDPQSLTESSLPPTLSYMSSNINTSSQQSQSEIFGGQNSNTSSNSSSQSHSLSSSHPSSTNVFLANSSPTGESYAHAIAKLKLPSPKASLKLSFNPSTVVTHVACSDSHTALLTSEGKCWTFGSGSQGQLGHGTMNGEAVPRLVSGTKNTRFKFLSVGPTHTVLANKSNVWIFGFGNPSPRPQPFAFGLPSNAIRNGLFSSFNICALASGTLHFLILTKEGDLFSWMHGIDKYPVAVNIDFKQLEKKQAIYQEKLKNSGFMPAASSSTSNSSSLSSSSNSNTFESSVYGLDRERHHIVKISCVASTNYVLTSDGLVFTFTNSQRRGYPFQRLNVSHRLRDFVPGRNHFLATVDKPISPLNSERPPVPPKQLMNHIEQCLDENIFTDVKLIANDGEARLAHKFVLSVIPEFAKQFTPSRSKPNTSPSEDIQEIKINEFNSIMLDLMLKWIYTGMIVLPKIVISPFEPKKLLGLSNEDRQSFMKMLRIMEPLDELADIIQGGRKAIQMHLRVSNSDLELTDESEFLGGVASKTWIHCLASHLESQIGNEKFADVELFIGKDDENHQNLSNKKQSPTQHDSRRIRIWTHRAILSSRSEWFRMMLSMSSKWTEAATQQVEISHLRQTTAKFLLSYLYTDSLPRDDELLLANLQELSELTAMADELLMPELKLIVSRRLSRMLKPENVCSILDLAETYQSSDLYYCIINYISKNVELLLRMGSLNDLTNNQIAQVEQVANDIRGYHPWRYFKQEQEDKIQKMALNINNIGQQQQNQQKSQEKQPEKKSDTLNSQTESTQIEQVDLKSSSDETATSPKVAPANRVYVPPNRRKAQNEQEEQNASLSTSEASTKQSFLDIQKEQLEAEERVKQEKEQKSIKSHFTWASSTASNAPQPAIINSSLSTTSQTAWPSLPGAPKSESTAATDPNPQEATSSSNASAQTQVESLAVAQTVPAKKKKPLPSPLRDPKTLSPLKDAVLVPKPAEPSVPEANKSTTSNSSTGANKAAKSLNQSSKSNQQSKQDQNKTKQEQTNQSIKQEQSTNTQAKAHVLSASAAAYQPSFVKPQQQQQQQQQQSQQPKQAKQNQTKSDSRSNQQKYPKQQQKQQEKRQQAQKQQKFNSDSFSASSSLNPPTNYPSASQSFAFNQNIPMEEIALGADFADDVDFATIQMQELALQNHRSKTLAEIQAEEQELEEHKLVEAYYAKLAEQQRLQEASLQEQQRQMPRNSGNQRGRGGSKPRPRGK